MLPLLAPGRRKNGELVCLPVKTSTHLPPRGDLIMACPSIRCQALSENPASGGQPLGRPGEAQASGEADSKTVSDDGGG
jgi:hypothetical protein